jgi:hypothetical protein
VANSAESTSVGALVRELRELVKAIDRALDAGVNSERVVLNAIADGAEELADSESVLRATSLEKRRRLRELMGAAHQALAEICQCGNLSAVERATFNSLAEFLFELSPPASDKIWNLTQAASEYEADSVAQKTSALRLFVAAWISVILAVTALLVLGVVGNEGLEDSSARLAAFFVGMGLLTISGLLLIVGAARRRALGDESLRLARQLHAFQLYIAPLGTRLRDATIVSMSQRFFPRARGDEEILRESSWPTATDVLVEDRYPE